MSSTATIPTKSEKTKLTPIENHKTAAAHFTEAAKHHTDAAKLVESGHEEKAAHATVKAHGHQIIAHDAHKDAVKQYAVKS